MKDVSEHSSREKGVWVTYGRGVYDITHFVGKHPGGDKIMMAAGGSVEPFWTLYGVHKKPEILAMMEAYRIGNIDEVEAVTPGDLSDPYGNEPRRHPALRPSSEKPYNAEPPPELLVESFITPQELFYVRNHLPVPEVDAETYELEISGLGLKKDLKLSLKDLKKFPKHTVTAAVQCAGNRRSEMTKVKPVKGLNWGHAAIGNATWTGVKLCDLLKHLGLKDDTTALHVQFEGLDTDVSNTPYGASIPIEKAMDPRGDVLLAYEMNGEPLSRDHGFPVRAIVPGVVGARNVKWLGRIVLSKDESDSHWQQNDYKGFSPGVDWDTVDFKTSPAIQELPVVSAICTPAEGEKVKIVNGKIDVKGYAWSGGGRKIIRIDVSCDRGATWHTAQLTDQNSDRHPHHWAWSLWSAQIPVSVKKGQMEVWVKAVDSSYNTQPEDFKHIWNLRGVLGNAYHKIKVSVY
ncbi:hypothetical protein AAG570_003291 [Ranatra chinensis]|uniref:Sulfite oxidase n=1 Tax=Ranatra chinensis TaxID=642074 RepID=A0ABD0YIS1_9HEMI